MAVDTRYITHDKWISLTATQVTYPNGRQVASGYDACGKSLMFNAAGAGGNLRADDATTTVQPMSEYLLTGRQIDPETKIYWYRARYYLPEMGRFSTRDPVCLGYGYDGGYDLIYDLVPKKR